MKKTVSIILTVIMTLSAVFFIINGCCDEEYTQNKVMGKGGARHEEINSGSLVFDGKLIDVPLICQYPQLPTGCESAAAAMVLQYYGIKITAGDFAGNWLVCDSNFYSIGGLQYGPDPNEVFAGDPFSERSYGCYADAIVSAVNKNSTECEARKITGKSLETLCEEYIDFGKPLLIWATMGMKPSGKGNTWYLKDGTEFTWIAGEHCLVLVGYSEDYYFFNDPQSGSTVAYKKEISELRFKELGAQAVCITKSDK